MTTLTRIKLAELQECFEGAAADVVQHLRKLYPLVEITKDDILESGGLLSTNDLGGKHPCEAERNLLEDVKSDSYCFEDAPPEDIICILNILEQCLDRLGEKGE